MLRTDVCWDQIARWVSTVMRESVEVSMGDSGRDGIPREPCGGGEGEHNVSTVRGGDIILVKECFAVFCRVKIPVKISLTLLETIGENQ